LPHSENLKNEGIPVKKLPSQPFTQPTLKMQTTFNACICGLGEVAAVLRVFAKQVTVYPNPARCTC
jgi:hypothetical protein